VLNFPGAASGWGDDEIRPPRNITKAAVERLKAGETVWDDGLPGFGARRQSKSVGYVLKEAYTGHIRGLEPFSLDLF
jgi:hypothetical protein